MNGLVKACCCRKIFRSWENFHRFRLLFQRGHKYKQRVSHKFPAQMFGKSAVLGGLLEQQ